MDAGSLRDLLDGVAGGRIDPDEAVARLARLPFADLGHSKIDHHRSLRQGLGEAVYAPGKSPIECAENVRELLSQGDMPVVLSRADAAQLAEARRINPGARVVGATALWRPRPLRDTPPVAVITAGTADGPVADECAAVLEVHGIAVDRLSDVGVAGLHRLLAHLDAITSAALVVVIAGMEGALASVIGGLTAAPVIAVPTSVGYGSSLSGVTALLAMHASCASGITVVGIDNGYGAACAALRYLNSWSADG